jgi:hypothetical protein
MKLAFYFKHTHYTKINFKQLERRFEQYNYEFRQSPINDAKYPFCYQGLYIKRSYCANGDITQIESNYDKTHHIQYKEEFQIIIEVVNMPDKDRIELCQKRFFSLFTQTELVDYLHCEYIFTTHHEILTYYCANL